METSRRYVCIINNKMYGSEDLSEFKQFIYEEKVRPYEPCYIVDLIDDKVIEVQLGQDGYYHYNTIEEKDYE